MFNVLLLVLWHARARWKVLGLANVNLGPSGRWVVARTGDGVTATLRVWLSFFLVTARDSMCISGSIRARWKFQGLANNRRETRDKRPLVRHPDKSWCHRHTIVSFLGLSTWIHELSGSTLVCCCRCLWSQWVRPEKLYTIVEVASATVRVSNQWTLVPSFT